MTETGSRRAAVVVNPSKGDQARLRHLVATAEQEHGWAPTVWFETTPSEPGATQARAATASGVDVVLAAGGDGTVRSVAEGLRGSGTALAVLPFGTGNLLVRNLGLPLGFEEAVRVAFGGGERRIDTGVVVLERPDGERVENVFLVMAGLGIDAKMIAKTNTALKKAVGWLAYVDGGVRALAELQPVRLRYSIDGAASRTVSVHSVMVGNCGVLPGGILLIPDAEPDDGVLDIVALRPRGPLGWLKVWNTITWENGVLRRSAAGRKLIDLREDARDVIYLKGRDVRIGVDEPQEIQLDGDGFGLAAAVRIRVDPGSLLVRVPQR
ncbi:diacylglycerol/lipid kinase family protein [Rathayibacter sp. VKM Ac-2630]|uniref:diacylglycerol/lipid kinase family protein n=1 Tax=Rathayibacter sp. VKM Ac-2630 TaxID=1938617 RepID=UPI0009C8D994|nr:diacylglycerol kinase family protein [Rathayibacter sp. VKM Ac-2630]OOB90164.1 diacylglycerol kinase [Rathayibacter sp. VKM Ac-2630]